MVSVRLAVIGGSGVATPELVRALRALPARERSLDIVLLGRSSDKLATVARAAALEAEGDPLLSVAHTTDPAEALQGADLILNQVRVGGMQARAFDESFPRELGLPGEETVGAGGFANASRTVPVVLEYARHIEAVCPQATLLTFANPASMVQYAISRYTSVQVVGMCDAPISFQREVAQALDVAANEIVVDYVGMHHFGWATRVWHQGRDRLPELLADPARVVRDVAPEIVQAYGALPGHYLGYAFHPDRMLARQTGRQSRASQLAILQQSILDDMAQATERGQRSELLAARKAVWYEAIIAPVIGAMIAGATQPPQRFVLNLHNGILAPWLPDKAVIEVPAVIDHGRIEPLAVGPVPAPVQSLIQANCAYETLAVEAIVERDTAKAAAALMMNPMICDYDQARAVVAKAWSEGAAT